MQLEAPLVTPIGKVVSIEKNIVIIHILSIPKTFVGFEIEQERLEWVFLPLLYLKKMEGVLVHIEKEQEKGRIILHLRVNTTNDLYIDQPLGQLFAKDERRQIKHQKDLDLFINNHLLHIPNASFIKEENHYKLILPCEEEDYILRKESSLFLHLENPPFIELLEHSSHDKEIKKTVKITTKSFYLLNELLIYPSLNGQSIPLLSKQNRAPFSLYQETPFRSHFTMASSMKFLNRLDKVEELEKIYSIAPANKNSKVATFISSLKQLDQLNPTDFVEKPYLPSSIPPIIRNAKQRFIVDRFIEQQPETPFLKAIIEKQISSEGVLFVSYFPSFHLKKLFYTENVLQKIKRIYFLNPSKKTPGYFSHSDRSFLLDLNALGIEIYWFEREKKRLLKFTERIGDYTGIFLPPKRIEEYHKATTFGIYGSSCRGTDIEAELRILFQGLDLMKKEVSHPLFNPLKAIAITTGGGPGVMHAANKIAFEQNLLSLAHICNFSDEPENPYLHGKMTYRIEKMIERQAEFLVKFPIFFIGGHGTDLEFSLELVGRQVKAYELTPVLLFGPYDYWKAKISQRFQTNLQSGTLRGSEVLSSLFFQVETGLEALKIYELYFENKLSDICQKKIYSNGFVSAKELFQCLT